ncbi:E3 ubiquitin/ISG15 ligase TRIM25-like [Rhinophrynus dorsalis]
MLSAALKDELNCSICNEIYTDPVTLPCGHSYCLVCITKTWDYQPERESSCPECRTIYRRRPELKRAQRLSNIAISYRSSITDEENDTRIFCTYCIVSPVPAVKSCLLCEASLCFTHLGVHSKSPEHVLTEPTTSLGNRKCSVHRKILDFYCSEDDACICVSCCLDGDHKGHDVGLLKEVSEKKKEKLRNVLEKLTSKRKETEKRVQSLHERRREVQGEAAGERERVTALIRDIREQLEDLETRVLSEISRREEQASLSLSGLIQQLEIKKDELSRKIHHIEEMCNTTDPLTVLQDRESDTTEVCGTEGGGDEDTDRDDTEVPGVGDLDVCLVLWTLYTGLADIVTGINSRFFGQEATDLLLDINTAGNHVHVSDDMKTASWSGTDQCHPKTPERFQTEQILSTRRFSSGRNHWEVEVSGSGRWRIGVAYASIERRGDQSWIGDNSKSWCLCCNNKTFSVIHDSKGNNLPHRHSCRRIRISLNYEAGRLSFYDVCCEIKNLHTFTTTFTEPLHAAFCVGYGAWVRILS